MANSSDEVFINIESNLAKISSLHQNLIRDYLLHLENTLTSKKGFSLLAEELTEAVNGKQLRFSYPVTIYWGKYGVKLQVGNNGKQVSSGATGAYKKVPQWFILSSDKEKLIGKETTTRAKKKRGEIVISAPLKYKTDQEQLNYIGREAESRSKYRKTIDKWCANGNGNGKMFSTKKPIYRKNADGRWEAVITSRHLGDINLYTFITENQCILKAAGAYKMMLENSRLLYDNNIIHHDVKAENMIPVLPVASK